jgi:hypothetical protein
MYELKKIGKVFTSKFVGTGPSSYEKIIYRAAVSQRLRNPNLKYYTVGVGKVRLYFSGFNENLEVSVGFTEIPQY